MYSSPRSSVGNSPSYKKSSFIHVCKLRRLANGKYKVYAIDGAERRHENFMWRFFSTINHQTSHDRTGITRQEINNVLLDLYPNGKYRTYYNYIIVATVRPKRLF